MSLEHVKELLIRTYARKYGVSEEQAREILAPLLSRTDKIESLVKLVEELQLAGGALAEIPDEARPIASKILMKELLDENDDLKSLIRDIKRLAVEVKILDTVFKTVFGGSQDMLYGTANNPLLEELRRQNEELKRENEELKRRLLEIMDMVKEKEREQREKELFDKISQLSSRMSELENKMIKQIEEYLRNPNSQQDPAQILNQFSAFLETYRRLQETLNSILNMNKREEASRELLEKVSQGRGGGTGVNWVEVLKLLVELAKTRQGGAVPFNIQQQVPLQQLPKSEQTQPQAEEAVEEEEFTPIPEEEVGESGKEEYNAIIVMPGE